MTQSAPAHRSWAWTERLQTGVVRHLSLPGVFLAAGVPLGLMYTFLMPPMRIPDETAHYIRAFGVSEGTCVALAQQTIPEALLVLPAGNPLLLRRSSPAKKQLKSPTERIAVNVVNANLYSCVPYLPAATAIAMARGLAPSPLQLFYTARCANLAVYLLLTFVALRLLPDWRLILFCLGLMPMTLHQAGSVSADAMTLATSFLYCAYILHLAFSPPSDPSSPKLRSRQFGILLLILLLASFCKFNIWMAALVLLIPAGRFGSNRRRWLAAAVALLVTLAAAAAWQQANRAHIAEFRDAETAIDKDLEKNAAFIYDDPGRFVSIVTWTLYYQSGNYAEQFVGNLGWLNLPLPRWLVTVFLVLLFVFALDGRKVRMSPGQRAVCALVVVASTLSLMVLLWTIETRQMFLTPRAIAAHQVLVSGVQGRYFIPFALLFFILFANSKIRLPRQLPVILALTLVIVASGVADVTIRNKYYAPPPQRRPILGRAKPRINHLGIFRRGAWLLDVNGTAQFDNSGPNRNPVLMFGGLPGDIPVTGDWTGDGKWKLGIYRNGSWLLDWNGDGKFSAADRTFSLGGLQGDIPVTGDWNGDGRTKIGVYRAGAWLLDEQGEGQPEDAADIQFYGGLPGDLPVTGDWNGRGRTNIGVYRRGMWILDSNGNGRFDDGDAVFWYGGLPGDLPVTGDWNGDGRTKVGVFRQGFLWVLDSDGNRQFDAKDKNVAFGGIAGDLPVAGRW